MKQRNAMRWIALLAAGTAWSGAQTQPRLTGAYTGRSCIPTSSEVCPEMNPEGARRLLTDRAQAFAAAFDELAAPKYDCWPATLPGLFGDPYVWTIEQQSDRVVFRYEKDDVVRTVWLEGHGHQPPAAGQFFVHGYSTGRYDGDRLIVETSKFVFDPAGLAGDFLSAPSSTQKHLTEVYWREGDNLRLQLTVQDPVFLREAYGYVIEWQPTEAPGAFAWNCDPVAAQRNLRMVPSKYPDDPPVVRRN